MYSSLLFCFSSIVFARSAAFLTLAENALDRSTTKTEGDAATYLGCFPLQVMPVRYDYTLYVDAAPMSLDVCSKVCAKVTQFYALFDGNMCFCAPFIRRELIPALGVVGCNMPCAGRSEDVCGGKETLSAYEIPRCGVPTPPCPSSRVSFDFSDYGITCRNQVKSRRFRRVTVHRGQFLDMVVESIDEGGDLTQAEMLRAITGIGTTLNFRLLQGHLLSVRIYFVATDSERREPIHNASFVV